MTDKSPRPAIEVAGNTLLGVPIRRCYLPLTFTVATGSLGHVSVGPEILVLRNGEYLGRIPVRAREEVESLLFDPATCLMLVR